MYFPMSSLLSHFPYKIFGPMYITSMLQWTVCDGAVGFHASDCVNYRRQYALKTEGKLSLLKNTH